MKLLYKPFGIIAGIGAARLSKRLAERLWALVDDDPAPSATVERTTWPKVLGAAAVQGATFSVTRAAADRAATTWFRHLFGVWPGEKSAEQSDSTAETA
jgi:hypothetical protein